MLPGTYNFSHWRGDTIDFSLRLQNTNPDGSAGAYINLTGMTGVGIAAAKPTADNPTPSPVATFTITIMDQVATPGGVRIYMPPTEAAKLTIGNLQWDLRLKTTATSDLRTYVSGKLTVKGGVIIP